MRVVIDDERHSRHCEALGKQLVEETDWALQNAGIAEVDRRRELARAVLFRVCAVLDGGAHGGTLDGNPIAPFVGFYNGGDTEEPMVPVDGSSMHAVLDDLVNEHFIARS